MRKRIVAGNWKMNKTPSEAAAFAKEMAQQLCNESVEVVFCVPYVAIPAVVEAVKGTCVSVGAQNMYFEDAGAYTGEISAKMLLDCGAKYVILGHSERREIFKESDELINKKVHKSIETGLVPIVCVGEKLDDRQKGITFEVVRTQLKLALLHVKAEDAEKLIVAYEPVWAIGTGVTASNEQAEEVCKAIRDCLAELYTQEAADKIRIQYGGSVNAGNAKALFSTGNIDGGLVGGASLKPEFKDIVFA